MKKENDPEQLPDKAVDGAARSEKRFFVTMSLLCAVALAVLFLGHPTGYAWMPRCPFYLLTGLYCPGCGSLRATHYLINGNLAESLRNHPLLIPMLGCVGVFYAKRIYEFRRNRNVTFQGELWLASAILMVLVVFFVLRNIPLDALEWTRPPEPVVDAFR